MLGGEHGTHALNIAMRRLRQACARDMLLRARQSGQFDPLIVATDQADWLTLLNDLNVTLDLDLTTAPFHFGRRLAGIIERHQFDRVLYLGAAAAPLLTTDQFSAIAETLRAQDQIVISNNRH